MLTGLNFFCEVPEFLKTAPSKQLGQREHLTSHHDIDSHQLQIVLKKCRLVDVNGGYFLLRELLIHSRCETLSSSWKTALLTEIRINRMVVQNLKNISFEKNT